jgi:HK97 family phage prohead protease
MSRAAIDLGAFHRLTARGERPAAAVNVQFRLGPVAAPAVGEPETRVVPFVFSDNSVDAYGDTIDARGWVYDQSGAGTVALFGHDASKVENIIGRAHNVRVQGNQLLGDIQFATREENPTADVVFQLVKGGYLNSVSVGFQPLEWQQTKDKTRPGGLDFKKQKLLEISVVGIPANENAVAQARAAGIDVDRVLFAATREAPAVTKRGLSSVSSLAAVLADLGWIQDSAAWEAEYEGDSSEVPAMLLVAMQQLGAALLAMTAEEVAELLDGRDDRPDGLVELAAPTAGQRGFAALARLAKAAKAPLQIPEGSTVFVVNRAGKVLSSANETKIRDVHAAMSGACDTLKEMLDSVTADETTEKAGMSRGDRLKDIELLAVPRR